MILLGCPGSGKSTIYTTLASALNSMNNKKTQPIAKLRKKERKISTSIRSAPKVPIEEIKEVLWPRVDLSVVFPKSLTCEEVLCAPCNTQFSLRDVLAGNQGSRIYHRASRIEHVACVMDFLRTTLVEGIGH